jgi:hypothetical protein
MRFLVPTTLMLAFSATSPSPACSLCAGLIQKDTLGRDFESATIVLYGSLANPRLSTQEGALPGSGSTDFQVDKVLKGESQFGKQGKLVLPRYLPVLDPKNPPRSVLFVAIHKEKLDPYLGRSASPAVVAYLEGALPHRKASRVQALHYYAKFLNDPDPVIADDAFLEFAKSTDADLGQVARSMAPEFVRGLLKQPKLDADRLSLYAFFLGGCGTDEDAVYLRSMTDQPRQTARALDGVLAGYINLRPKEGWELTHALLADRKQNFQARWGAVRTLRFYHGWKPKEAHEQILRGMSIVLLDGENADMALEDLRQWKMWDLTTLVLAQYGKQSHSAPITRRAILRYALSCPLPEARDFIERVRPREREDLADIEAGLQFEGKK